MRVARDLAGFSLAKADEMRRAMGKKDLAKMEAMKDAFIKGDMAGFIKLAEKTNLSGKGHGEGGSEGNGGGASEDADDRALKLAEEKHKEWGIPLHEAISKARKIVK